MFNFICFEDMTSTNFNSPVTGVAHGEKPEKFGGVDFKRWQQKMLFYLTTLNLAKFLTEDAPILLRENLTKKSNLQLMHGNMQNIFARITF